MRLQLFPLNAYDVSNNPPRYRQHTYDNHRIAIVNQTIGPIEPMMVVVPFAPNH